MRGSGCRNLALRAFVNKARSVATTLTNAGYLVTVAVDGEEGLRQVEIDAPDLILCDLHLPGIDGSAVVVEAEHGPIRRQLQASATGPSRAAPMPA